MTGHPYIPDEAVQAARAFGAQWRNGSDAEYYAGIVNAALPHLKIATLAEVEKAATAAAEETFASRIAELEPGIRADERAKVETRLREFHWETDTNHCAACGDVWPCDTILELWSAES